MNDYYNDFIMSGIVIFLFHIFGSNFILFSFHLMGPFLNINNEEKPFHWVSSAPNEVASGAERSQKLLPSKMFIIRC